LIRVITAFDAPKAMKRVYIVKKGNLHGGKIWQKHRSIPVSTAALATKDGEIRKKRSDTLVGTLRDEYGDDFAMGYRSDSKLRTVLEREGVDDLSQLLKKKRG
jgi:hypothetical protein